MATGPNKQLDAILDAFQARKDVPDAAAAALRKLIVDNPVLLAKFNAAAAAGHLAGFELQKPGVNAGGTFHPVDKTIHLRYEDLVPAPGGAIDKAGLTFVLAHEVQHAINAPSVEVAMKAYSKAVMAIAQGPGPVHDYTAPIATMLDINKRDEAKAEIAGWNALRASLVEAGVKPTLAAMHRASPYRMDDFIDVDTRSVPPKYSLKPGLHLAADMSMPVDAANTTALVRHYSGQSPADTKIGAKGNSDYANYYGATLVGWAIYLDRLHAAPGKPSTIVMDLSDLGLRPGLLQDNGLNLGTNVGVPQTVVDGSGTATVKTVLKHTSTEFPAGYPIEAEPPVRDAASVREPASIAGASASAAGDWRDHLDADRIAQLAAARGAAREPGRFDVEPHAVPSGAGVATPEPNGALLDQAQAAVARLDARIGRTPDAFSDQLAAMSARIAAQHGLRAVDHVLLNDATPALAAGERVFVVEGAVDSPTRQVLSFPTREAFAPAANVAAIEVDTRGLRSVPGEPAEPPRARTSTLAV